MRLLIFFLLILSISASACNLGASQQGETDLNDRPPNLIFLLTDDHRADALGAAGNDLIKTPQLDRLARRGIHFKNAYVTTSICMISRASVLTGQYASRHQILDFQTSLDSAQLANSYPLLLQKNGYRIGFIGKYGVGNPKDQPAAAYDYWAATPLHQPRYENEDSLGNYLHYTDLISQKMIDFLTTNDERPFALSVSFKAPHSEDGDPRQFIPHPRYDSLYRNLEVPVPPTAAPRFLDRLPAALRDEKNIARKRWHLRFDTPERYQQSVKNYYRLITGVDDAVGRLRAELAQRGLAENTVIVFMGDNGFYLGEHGLAGKWFGHEESIRVPLIIYDPRLADAPRRPAAIALNIDIAPTLLGLAGIDPPAQTQGIDLLAALRQRQPARADFFYEHAFLGSPRLPVTEGVVSPQLKYLIYPESGTEELYDLSVDPLETTNLIGDPTYGTILEEKRKRYRELKQAAQ